MPKLWEKTSGAKDISDLKVVELESLKITSPTVVFLSGRETTDENLPEISKSIHYMNKILPGNPQVYSWSHGGQLSRAYNTLVYHSVSQRIFRPSIIKLAAGLFLPLVSDDGQRLPFEEAQKNFRNLTLVGYSAGSIVAQELFNVSLGMMKDIGYTPEESRRLLKEVVLVTIGTVSRPSREKDRFTTISLANSDDWFVSAKNFMQHPIAMVFFGAGRSRKLKIEQLSDTSLLVTAAARKNPWEFGKGKQIIDGVELPAWNPKMSNHEAIDYINDNDDSNQMSRIALYALANAVNRKETLTPLQLLEPPAHVKPEDEKAYRQRIYKAFKV